MSSACPMLPPKIKTFDFVLPRIMLLASASQPTIPNMPRAYYNEIDLYCAEWLYNLQKENLIAPGDIDTRPIQDVRPSDLRGYAQHHFFAGIGGWSYALRQAHWPDHREVWTGSCPCQPFSLAGKRGGFADDRHLWPYWRYLVEVERPAIVFGEQVASAADWLRLVRGDLEKMGYAVGAMPIEAASAGADHKRDRFWFVGYGGRSEWWKNAEGRKNVDDGADPGRQKTTSRFAVAVRTHDLAHSTQQQFYGTGNTGADRRDKYTNGSADAVANSSSTRLQIGERDGRVQREALGASARQTAERNGVANSDLLLEGYGELQRSGQQRGPGGDQEARGGLEWVLGADGKARRVKPGVCLLAHGIPNRVGKLRGFGNAIDHRPAQAFIESVMEIISA